MFQRITKSLLVAGLLIGLACAIPSKGFGWSLNPFASKKPDAKTYPTNVAKKSTSPLDKVSTGTKNFFNKTGETLGLKKPQPKKPPAIVAAKPRQVPQKYQEKKSWLDAFKPAEREKPKDVKGWIGNTKPVIP